jgi:ABC-type nitrate/sulfonate/bicarbonate transport system substrate-binding protein
LKGVVVMALDRRAFLKRGAAGAAGFTLLSSGLLVACGDDDKSESSSSGGSDGTPDYGTLDLQLSWIKNAEFAGHYIADQKGYYKEAGFSKVNMISGGPNVSQDAVVAAGKAFVGISTPDIAASAILEGAPNIAIGAEYQKNPFCVMSLADNPINTPEEMIGKKIGVQAVNDPVWDAWLKALEIDPSEIEKVVVQFDPQPLVNGEVDGWFSFVTNEPNLLKVQGVDTVNILLNDNKYPMVSEVYIVRKDSLEKDRDKIKAFLTAANRGWKDNIKDPALGAKYTVEIYGKDLGLTVEEQTLESKAEVELIYTEDAQKNGLFTITDELIEQTLSTLALGGIEIEKDELFDLSVLDELYTEKPELKEPV